jgi:vancomycin aglycone glucosyltransferase
VPQVIIPQAYDQPYWAQRVTELGIGTNCPPGTGTPATSTPDAGTRNVGTPDARSLAEALDRVLQPAVAARAQALRPALRTTGTHTAATNLTTPAANPTSLAANPTSLAANPTSLAATPAPAR